MDFPGETGAFGFTDLLEPFFQIDAFSYIREKAGLNRFIVYIHGGTVDVSVKNDAAFLKASLFSD